MKIQSPIRPTLQQHPDGTHTFFGHTIDHNMPAHFVWAIAEHIQRKIK